MCSHVEITLSLFGLSASDNVPRAAETLLRLLLRASVKTMIYTPVVSLRQGSIALVSLYLCWSQLDYTLLSCAGI